MSPEMPAADDLTIQSMPLMSRTACAVGAVFALSAFIVALASGATSANSMMTVLSRGLIAMIICYPLGLMVGLTASWVVRQHVAEHMEANPVPHTGEQEPDSVGVSSDTEHQGDGDVLVV